MSARRASSALIPLAWIAAIALALWLAFRHGFANYDTFYALVWGDEIAHGEGPDLDVLLPPTPHPLATFAGIVLSPLGDGAEDAVVAIAFLSLGAIGYLTYRLGSEWFNRPVGLLASAIVLTRVPMLDFGVRSYVDIPYIALVLAALLVETKRPREGWPVLAGAAVGVVLTFALLRRRAALALASGALAVCAFSLLAFGGLAVITRYLLLVGVIVSIFCAVAVFG